MKIPSLSFQAKTKKYQIVQHVEQPLEVKSANPLTLIIAMWLVLCCLSWTLTTWIAAQVDYDQCPDIPDNLRFDCHPDPGISEESCQARGCCWRPPEPQLEVDEDSLPLNIPYCYYPDRHSFYKHGNSSVTKFKITHDFANVQASAFPKDVENVQVQVTCFDKSILRVKILDKDNPERYQVPYTNFENVEEAIEDCDLKFKLSDDQDLRFQIRRKSNHEIL